MTFRLLLSSAVLCRWLQVQRLYLAENFNLAPNVHCRVLLNDWAKCQSRGMEVFPGISMDPDVRFGKPCLSGTRIDVATVMGALAAGESTGTVAAEYSLSVGQIQTSLHSVRCRRLHLAQPCPMG